MAATLRRAPERHVDDAAPAVREPWWLLGGPLLASGLWSALFIARSAFSLRGEVYFSLFDDAMVSMRFARNLADGDGLVWNAGGPPVEGYTNLLWTLWMAGLHRLGAPESIVSLLVMISGALLLLANVAVVGATARRLLPGSQLIVGLATWLTALYYPLVYWTLRGMEVGLIALLISVMALLALRLRAEPRRRDLALLAATMALAVLTRTDAAIPCLIAGLFVVVGAPRGWRAGAALALGGALGGALALHTAFRLAYYGNLVPNTYYLKVQGFPLQTRLAAGLAAFADTALFHWCPALIVVACCLILYRNHRRATPGVILLSLLWLGQCAYSTYVGGDAWEALQYANRYLAPAAPALFLVCAWLLAVAAEGRARCVVVEHRPIQRLILVGLPATLGLALLVGGPGAGRLVVTLALAGLLALSVLWLARRAPYGGVAIGPTPATRQPLLAVALALLIGVNGPAAGEWVLRNAAGVPEDAAAVAYGLALRDATAPDTRIAVAWAGSIPYFARRPSIDLLGKNDPAIATSAPRAVAFRPGHNKWDYAESIGRQRPDVIAQLWWPTDDELRALDEWGYVRLTPTLLVRADAPGVDRDALDAGRLDRYVCCLPRASR